MSVPEGDPEEEATVEEDWSVVLLVDGAAAMLVPLSLEEGALVDGEEEVDAVLAAFSSCRPQPASTATTARAVAASVSFFMDLSLGLTMNSKILGAHL
jgi:hypothetical protein